MCGTYDAECQPLYRYAIRRLRRAQRYQVVGIRLAPHWIHIRAYKAASELVDLIYRTSVHTISDQVRVPSER